MASRSAARRCAFATQSVLLVGCGPMAVAYAHALIDLDAEITVAGRGEESAADFARATKLRPMTGGIERVLDRLENPPAVGIVAVPVSGLATAAKCLIEAGVRRILVEKPGALTRTELEELCAASERIGSTVLIAYNRRFYESVRQARRLIAEDGGVTSFTFDFTELSEKVGSSSQPQEVKERWFFANSTHVVDLAFFLGGEPVELDALVEGSLEWHPVARFAGSGRTDLGALFSYHADWSGPGRWGVEVVTRNQRLVLRPLEELRAQRRGEWDAALIESRTDIDTKFKPGIRAQVEAFLSKDDEDFLNVFGQIRRFDEVYEPMIKGTS